MACKTKVSSIGVQCYQYIGGSFVRAVAIRYEVVRLLMIVQLIEGLQWTKY